MATIRTNDRYHTLSIGAHWLTLVLLIAVYALIELRGIYPKGSDPHDAMKAWHFMLGLTVLGLVFVRLALRLAFRAPPITPEPPAWVRFLATAMYAALYAFLIVMPLLGWLALSAKGKPIPFFGLQLPALIGPDKVTGGRLEDIHETIGTVGYYLIGLHAFAALFHHYFTRDDTLLRMLPRRSNRSHGITRQRQAGSSGGRAVNIDRMVMGFAGSTVTASVALSYLHSPWWLLLTLFVGLNLAQASYTGFCPLARMLRRLGVRPGSAFPDQHSDQASEGGRFARRPLESRLRGR